MSHHHSPSRAGSEPLEPVRAARHTIAHRREVLTAFFSRYPGNGRHRLGFGRALGDFQEWEIRSGRLGDGSGSPWWSTVNGILVNDLAAANGGAAGPWQDYSASPPEERQARLWLAHQYSINRGVAAAEDLLIRESNLERAFIEVALGVVEMAAAVDLDTSSGSLGRRTTELYPRCYPCDEAELEHLKRELGL